MRLFSVACRLFSVVTCESQCELRRLCANAWLSALLSLYSSYLESVIGWKVLSAFFVLTLFIFFSDYDVVEISSSEEDEEEDEDVVMVASDQEEEEEEEEGEKKGDVNNSGSHINDEMNQPDAQGRVLVNIGHPPDEPDIYLAPQITSVVKPHQVRHAQAGFR